MIEQSRASRDQRGFTIIELMISLGVLSLILLLSTYTILQIGSIYTKGTNMAATQNTTRNIVADITSQLQLGGATPIFVAASPNVGAANQSPAGALCIGSRRYSFVLNHKLSNNSNDHVLWHDTMDSSSTCAPLSPLDNTSTDPPDLLHLNTSSPNNGREIMPVNTRLVDLNVRAINGLYVVSVGIAYGDDELMTYTPRIVATPGDAVCKGVSGDAFCAVSALEKTVIPRITE